MMEAEITRDAEGYTECRNNRQEIIYAVSAIVAQVFDAEFVYAGVRNWRRERDSNPRYELPRIPTFQAGAFDHSATSPFYCSAITTAQF